MKLNYQPKPIKPMVPRETLDRETELLMRYEKALTWALQHLSVADKFICEQILKGDSSELQAERRS